jgi:PAS domain S-box-containing protein
VDSNTLQAQHQWQQERNILSLLATLSYRTGELNHYLHEIAYDVSRLLESDWSIVTLCQGETGTVLASNLELAETDYEFSLYGSLASKVMQIGRSLCINNIHSESIPYVLPSPYLAYLGVPLCTPHGNYIGTICSFFCKPAYFSPETLQLVEFFAERAATAIDNYQLYQQQKQIAAELKILNTRLQAEIQERRQVEAALRQSEARFKVLVDNAGDAFLLLDPDDGRILDANHRACENLGYSIEELLNLSIHEIDMKCGINPIQPFRQQLVVGVPSQLESLYRRKDSTLFPVEANVCVFESGNRLLALALVRDISERKQAEQAVARLAEIGELAAMIVHEIRNPLTTVLMGLSAFQQIELPERSQERLILALEEAERLKRLLNEILLYAKQQIVQGSEWEINALMAGLLESLRAIPAAAERQIKWIPCPDSAWIWGDRDKLKQILINLVRNACEAVQNGDIITLQASTTPKSICIRIHNGGSPIPPEILAKLGTPFFTTKPSGNGLGLAIVRRIVEAHKGELQIESDALQGTTVSIYLPTL